MLVVNGVGPNDKAVLRGYFFGKERNGEILWKKRSDERERRRKTQGRKEGRRSFIFFHHWIPLWQ